MTRRWILSLVVWGLTATGVNAAERAVGPSGAYRTIQAAVDAAGPGDTITVRAGTYNEHIRFKKSGAAGKPIVLRAYPGERPIIISPLGVSAISLEPTDWQTKGEIGWINVEGFELVGNATAVRVFELVHAHHIEIRRNYIHDGGHQGILGNGHDVIIDGNEIARCGDPSNNQNHGMYLTGHRFTITNNVVHDNSSFGLQAAAYNCAGSCPGIEYGGVVDWLIANNVFAFEKNRAGITVWLPGDSYGPRANGPMSNVRILNNVFYDNGNEYTYTVNGIYFRDIETIQVKNNLFYSSIGKASLGREVSVNAKVADNIDANPKFVAATKRNFHLEMGSPAIGKGLNLFNANVTKDFDGKGRPKTGAFDIGAYQAAGTLVSSTPSAPEMFAVH